MKTIDEMNAIWSTCIDQHILKIEYVDVLAAQGCVLAENVVTPIPIPHFDKSAVDGYAICGPDKPHNLDTYKLVARLGAGECYKGELRLGEAVRIMTGAPIPKGANTVVMQEQCSEEDAVLSISGNFTYGSHIIYKGEDCPANTLLLRQGTLLNAAQIAVLAGVGINRVPIYENPRVLVMSTGREVVMPHEPLSEGQIYNSNLYMLIGLLREIGIEAVKTHHMTDDPTCIEKEITHLQDIIAKERITVVISTGGVSVGDYDVMPMVYERLGAKMLYNRLPMRPGAASYGGYNEERNVLFFGLSGNPTAAYNCFQLIVKPVLRMLQGYSESDNNAERFYCKLGSELAKTNPLDRYIQGIVRVEKQELVFYPNEVFMASSLASLATVHALGIMRAGTHELHIGDRIEVICC